MLTSGTEAYETGQSLITPVASKPILPWDKPDTYDYFLGPSVFVSPVLAANVTHHSVQLPKGEWVDWFNHTVYQGSILNYPVSLDVAPTTYPVFQRRGSMVVINPSRNLFLPTEQDSLHLQLAAPRPGDEGHVAIRRYQQRSQEVFYSVSSDGKLSLKVTAHPRPLHLFITGSAEGHQIHHDATNGTMVEIQLQT